METTVQSAMLPRGGVILSSPIGPIQYGVVPETIKDTMESPQGVPTIFVLPSRLFDAARAVSLGEIEFPAYWNYFCKGTRTTVVCRPGQLEALQQVLAQAAFGPRASDPAEFARPGADAPDLLAEMAYFRTNPKTGRPMELSDLVDVREIDGGSGVAELSEGVQIAVEDHGGIAVLHQGKAVSRWSGDAPMPRPKPISSTRFPFRPPSFGVTVIGSGHGFDPGNRTSGFLIWIDGRGVMVDPPVDAIEWLQEYDIGPRQVDSLILTHCHADHDAGTLQKILQEGRITIYTTPTIMASFVTKYSNMIGMDPAAFRRLFDYVPVHAGEPVPLHGAEAIFNYSLHSIPCVGFEVFCRGRSLVYPSDTLNDPDVIRRLRDEGVLSQERARKLVEFPWHHQLVLHEAGIPPIHTPVKVLAGLEDAIKKRLLLVHVSERSLPADSGLKVAPTGLDRTIDLQPEDAANAGAIETLDILARVDVFEDLPLPRAADFLRCVRRETHAARTRLLTRGESVEALWVIARGSATIYREGAELQVYGEYDYFGESALVTGEPSSIEVVARTDITLLAIPGPAFFNLVRGTRVLERLRHLAELRKLPAWEALSHSPVFEDLTANQRTQLQQLMQPVQFAESDALGEDPVLIEAGRVDGPRAFKRGDLAGDLRAVVEGTPMAQQFHAATRVQGYAFHRAELQTWLAKNPGFYLRLLEAENQAPGSVEEGSGPTRYCIGCGGALPLGAQVRTAKDPNASQMMSFGVWFHDECPIESNFLKWKYCAKCGAALEGEGPKARCAACDLSLPSLYQHCAVSGM
ncbi:MAG: cyclic nucleotide-binding domain-containing protein [Candidatus Xenobia bacterium]